tara:strand:- start:28 stop:984 length:957 start_codon:yes stop_codon:yes gene_type:complete
MNYNNAGALPTNKIDGKFEVSNTERLQLFTHYLNHRCCDIPGKKKNASKKLVIEAIIENHGRQYIYEKYVDENSDKFQDLRQVAQIKVWEATEKYINGSKYNNKVLEYKSRFNFCVFASNYINYQLRLYLRELNRDRSYGYLPNSDNIRKLYTILPKYKKNNPQKKQLSIQDYEEISLKNKIKLETVINVDRFFNSRSISGDEKIKINQSDLKNKWEILEIENIEDFTKDYDTSKTFIKNERLNIYKKIIKSYLKPLSEKEKEIFIEIKLKDSERLTLKDLGKKYNISSERVRQISEKLFKDFKVLILKNKNYLSYRK